MDYLYWDVVKQGGVTHAVFENAEGCVYDPEISRLVGNPVQR